MAKLTMALESKYQHHHFKDIEGRHFNAVAARIFHRGSAEGVINEVLKGAEPTIAAGAVGLRPWISRGELMYLLRR